MNSLKTVFGSFLLLACLFAFAGSANAAVLVVKKKPPVVKVEVRPRAPYAGAVWVNGRWAWKKGKYVWVKGYYVKPRKGYVWVPGHWNKRPGGYVWVAGHWRRI